MDELAFLESNELKQHYLRGLKRRVFRHWKGSLSKFHLQPCQDVRLVQASFAWLRTSFSSEDVTGDTPVHLFPFYAAIEKDGEASAYFIDRLRKYMFDKLEVPVLNLPLLVHAVAMFDAYQLTRCFTEWQAYYFRCSALDRFARHYRYKRFLRRWFRNINRKVFLRTRFIVLQRRGHRKVTKSTFNVWCNIVHAIRYRSEVIVPRNTRSAFLKIARYRAESQYQRLTLRNGMRFHLQKTAMQSFLLWLSRLSRLSSMEVRVETRHLFAWLLQVVQRNWIESQELRDMYITAFGSRSKYFRCHRFIAHLAHTHQQSHTPFAHISTKADQKLQSPKSKPVSPVSPHSPKAKTSKAVLATYPSTEYFNYATPSKAALHVSFDVHPHEEIAGNDADHTLHSSALDATWFSPASEDNEEAEEVMGLLDSPGDDGLSILHPSKLLARAYSVAPSPTASGYGHRNHSSTAGTSKNHMQLAIVSTPRPTELLKLIKQNPSSRLAQGWMLLSAAKFQHYRHLNTALHRWMHRVPQIKLDSPHTFAIFFPMLSQQNVLHRLILQCTNMTHRPAHYYLVYKKLRYALLKWVRNCRRKVFLRTRSVRLKRTNFALRQAQAFGAWLVTTARFQQLHRTANRLVCNRFKAEIWRAWFAWRHQYERSVLIRTNNLELLRLRTQEIQSFTATQGEKRTHRAQFSALREWSFVVQGKKHIRAVCVAWHNTVGRRKLSAAWQAWRLFMRYDGIAGVVQRLWRGYRVRRLYNAKLYQHLQRFRVNVTKYMHCRRVACKRKIFGILMLYCRIVREGHAFHMQNHIKSTSISALRRFTLRRRQSRRVLNRAKAQHISYQKRSVFVTIRDALRQRLLHQQITRLYVLRRTAYLLRRWRRHQQAQVKQDKAMTRCNRFLLRRAWRVLRKRCRQNKRIRQWQVRRLRLRAKQILRFWSRILTKRAQSKVRTFELYKRRRFRTWFQWWHQKIVQRTRERQINTDQRAVFLLRQRGGRHFEIVRGIISARVRWYLKKFIAFTSFRRRERALQAYLNQRWRKNKLSTAFQHMYLECHRTNKHRRRVKSTGLDFGDSLLARRYRRDSGAGSVGTGTGFSGTLGRRLPSTVAMLSGVAARQRAHSGASTESLRTPSTSRSGRVNNLFHTSTNTATFVPLSNRIPEATGRFRRRPSFVGVRHAVSRKVARSRDEILKILHDNAEHAFDAVPYYSQRKRMFTVWLQFTRYNGRNRRALVRLENNYWGVAIRDALKRLYVTLIHRRQRRARARKVLTTLQVNKVKKFISLLRSRARRRRRQNHFLKLYQQQLCVKFKKHFFRRMYTICYFNRFALKLKCIKRLRGGVKSAFKKLRYIAWHHLRSPGATAIKKLDLKRKAIAFRKMRGLILKGKLRRALGRMSDAHCNTMRKMFLFRFWRKFKNLRRQLKRIVRRITFIPIMKMWHSTAMELQHAHRSIHRVQKRVTRNTKKTIFSAWKTYSEYCARLKHAAEEVRQRSVENTKLIALCTWLRRIDQKINTDKAYQVQQLSMKYLLRRCMFHWHKQALISELCTWKSTKAAVRNWHISTYISQRLRMSFIRAEAFHDAYLAQVYLYLWYKRIARRLLLQRRREKALRLKNLRNYLVSFRKWKRRMYLVYRARMFLSPVQREPRLFNLKRSIRKWCRAVRVKVHHGRRRTLRKHLQGWQSYTYKQRFARIAFLDRLHHFRQRELISKPFHALIYNCKALRMQKLLFSYTNLTTKAKVWAFWHKMSVHRQRERFAMRRIIGALYRGSLHGYFRTWRVRTTMFAPLLQQNAVSQVLRKWKLALVARRQWRYSLLSKVVAAWRSYFYTVDMNKVILLRKRRPMWRILIKKIRDDMLKVAVAFMRWKSCDDSIHVCEYRRYPQWANHTVAHDFYTNFPMQHLNQELGASHAGRFLTSTQVEGLTSLHAAGVRRRPALRLAAIQKHLERRFHGGDGTGVGSHVGHGAGRDSHFYASPSKSPPRRSRSASPTTRGARTPVSGGATNSGRKYALMSGSHGVERYKQSLFSPGSTGLLPVDVSPVVSRVRSPSSVQRAAEAHSPGIALRAFSSPPAAASTPYAYASSGIAGIRNKHKGQSSTGSTLHAAEPSSILFSRGKGMKVNELM